MTITDVDTELEDLLRESLAAVAAATPTLVDSNVQPARRRALHLAAAAVVVAGTAGVATVAVRDRASAPSTAPTSTASPTTVPANTGPILLAPRADMPRLEVTAVVQHRSSPGFHEGAVRTAGGDVIGFTVQANPLPLGGAGGPAEGEERWLGDRRVVGGLAEGGETGVETYLVDAGCAIVAVTTSHGMDRWAPEFVALVEQLDEANGAVTVDAPAGWESLGSGHPTDQYGLSFIANLDGEDDHEFMLSMRPGVPVGVWLANPGSETPRPATLRGAPAWLVGETGGGWRTLAYEHRGTAVLLSGLNVTSGQLLAMADNLVEQPWDATETMMPTTTAPIGVPGTGLPQTVSTGQPIDSSGSDCAVSLAITESQ